MLIKRLNAETRTYKTMRIKSQLHVYTPVYPIECKGFVLIVIINNKKMYFYSFFLCQNHYPITYRFLFFLLSFHSFFIFHLLLHYDDNCCIYSAYLNSISVYIFTNFTVHFGRRESIDVFFKIQNLSSTSNSKDSSVEDFISISNLCYIKENILFIDIFRGVEESSIKKMKKIA